MKVLPTPYTEETGIVIVCQMPKVWRHFDTNDGGARPVGEAYASRKELIADHVDYLLKSGWLKLTIPLPVPTLEVLVDKGVYAWKAEDTQVGIMVFADSAAKAVADFKKAVFDEYGACVTIVETPPQPMTLDEMIGDLFPNVQTTMEGLMNDRHIIPYRVILTPAGASGTVDFDCAAEFDLQAEAKAKEAYPGCTIETCVAYAHLLFFLDLA